MAGTQFVLAAVACSALGLLLSIGYNLKRIMAAPEVIASKQGHAAMEKPE
jgi:hypothetical protein